MGEDEGGAGDVTDLLGLAATVEATLRGLEGAWLAHLAAHRHNVLLSKLDLADARSWPTTPR
jgi:hypothetical protein